MSGKCSVGWMKVLVVELILTLMLLPGCFGGEEKVYGFAGKEIPDRLEQTEEAGNFESDRMELKPGVYRVRTWTELPQGTFLHIQMDCDQGSYKAIRCNGAVLLGGQEEGEFLVYVRDRTDTAFLSCGFSGAGPDALKQIDIYGTSLGNRMLLTGALAVFCLLDFLLLFRKRILEGRVTGKQQAVFWTLTAGILLACFPYLTDYFYLGDNGLFYVSRISFLSDTLKEQGSWPVWVQGTWMYGHGYGVSLFSSDLFYLFPACLQILGFSPMTACRIFLIGVTAATGVIAYCSFYRCVRQEYPALAGSLFYLLSPCRFLDMYERGEWGELLGMTFFPLVCCGVYLLFSEDPFSPKYKNVKWYIVCGMSFMVQCHLPMAGMTVFFMALCCVILWKKTFRRRTFVQLGESVGLVLLFNAWFLVPMLYMQKADQYHFSAPNAAFRSEGGLSFSGLFQMLPTAGERMAREGGRIGFVHFGAGAVMVLLLYLGWRLYAKKGSRTCDILALSALISLALSMKWFPWEAVWKVPVMGTVMGAMQSPGLWLAPASGLTAMLAAFFCSQAVKTGGKYIRAGLYAGTAAAVILAVYYLDSIAFEKRPVWLYNMECMGTAGVGSGEYLLAETESVSAVTFHGPAGEEGLSWQDYEKKGTNIVIALQNGTEEERCLELPLFGYRGYGIRELKPAGTSVSLPYVARDRGRHGDLKIVVPPGYEGTVEISYRRFSAFYGAGAVSLTSLAAAAAAQMYGRHRRRSPHLAGRRQAE